MGKMHNRTRFIPLRDPLSAGFGLMEVMAPLSLMVALMGLLSLFGHRVAGNELVQEDWIAEQKARECLESIFSARNTGQLAFDRIQNSPDGIFLPGFRPLSQPNPVESNGDGVAGTADDGPVERLVLPGPDGQVGTVDDEVRVLDQFDRQIQIDPVLRGDSTVNPDVRRVIVRVRYPTPLGGHQLYELESYVSRFRWQGAD